MARANLGKLLEFRAFCKMNGILPADEYQVLGVFTNCQHFAFA
jgi:hypothetical protein